LLVACRTLEAYTVQGAWDPDRFPPDRRSFGPGARTETHASRPESLSPLPHGQAHRVLAKPRKRAGTRPGIGTRPGGMVGPRRQKKRLMGLERHPHRRLLWEEIK
jgi:hypothetical protein